MISNRAISYIILIIFYTAFFIIVKIFEQWFLPFEKTLIEITLFTFFTTLAHYFAIDKIQKLQASQKGFLTLAFRTLKFILFLFFSIYIYFTCSKTYFKEAFLIYVSLFFITAFLEILHITKFSRQNGH